MKKIYKNGLLIGRFQPFHRGHEYMIRMAFKFCQRVIVFIGSCTESRTNKNPLNYEERKTLIELVFKKEIENGTLLIYPLEDKGYGDVPAWGEFIIDSFYKYTSCYPDLYVSGVESERANWLTNIKIDRLYISRGSIKVSATEVRHALKCNYKAIYEKLVPKQLYKQYNKLKEIIDEVFVSS